MFSLPLWAALGILNTQGVHMFDAVVTPKIADISSIKGISTLLALPMLCVAYFLQTGATITWDDTVWFGLGKDLPVLAELSRLILLFLIKSIWISFWGMIAYGVLTQIYIHITFPFIELASVLMIAVALFGIFCSAQFSQLKLIDPFWFYGFIVWGVFFQSMKEQLDTERQKISSVTHG
jgi:ABC-type transport system involved in multi-copper enzyme maturation permease subunit